jgi:PH (Pleckstrin Homology) domain-containing protein
LWALYVIPLALTVFMVRTKTVATPQGLAVRTMFGHRELPWKPQGTVDQQARQGADRRQPDRAAVSVRARHLPVLALVSNGRPEYPTGLVDDLVTPPEKKPEE